MAKRFTMQQDLFLVRYGGSSDMNTIISRHDMPHSKKAIDRRCEKLKETGAWDFLAAVDQCFNRAAVLMGHKLDVLFQIDGELRSSMSEPIVLPGIDPRPSPDQKAVAA